MWPYFKWTLLSLIASFVFSLVFAKIVTQHVVLDGSYLVQIWIVWLFCALAAIGMLLWELRKAIARSGAMGLWALLGHYVGSYGGLIFTFAGFYFSICTYEDYNWACRQFDHYAQDPPANSKEDPLPADRAGIGPRPLKLWYTIGYPRDYPSDFSGAIISRDVSDPVRRKAAYELRDQRDDTIAMARPSEVLDVAIDCCYFSAVTITTLGYGDITPKTRYAMVTAALEALLGVLFASLLVGVLINRFK